MTSETAPIRHLLVPLDGSASARRGLAVATLLAAALGADVAVVGVVDHEAAVAGAEADLAATVADAVTASPVAVTVLVADDVAAAIIGAAAGATMCLATDGVGHGSHTLLGRIAMGVVRGAGSPVVLAGPRVSPATPTRVVACLDGSPFAEAAVPTAHALATQLDVPLVLVQVVEEGAGGAVDVPESGYVEHQARPLGGEVSFEVLHGSGAAAAITAWIGDDPGTVVVLASHGRSGLSQLVLGSVAAGVVADAAGPVVVVPATE